MLLLTVGESSLQLNESSQQGIQCFYNTHMTSVLHTNSTHGCEIDVTTARVGFGHFIVIRHQDGVKRDNECWANIYLC